MYVCGLMALARIASLEAQLATIRVLKADLQARPDAGKAVAQLVALGRDELALETQLGQITDVARPHEQTRTVPPGMIRVKVATEADLIDGMLKMVMREDPDFLVGYETDMTSWGYLVDRANALKQPDEPSFDARLSRMKPKPVVNKGQAGDASRAVNPEEDPAMAYNIAMSSKVSVKGRVVLNVWRRLKSDEVLKLRRYDFENVAFHVLHRRMPLYTPQQLALWWATPEGHAGQPSSPGIARHRVMQFYMNKVVATMEIIKERNVVQRTSEFSRVYGVLYRDAFMRGSQHKVESTMLRLLHQDGDNGERGFVMFSPSADEIKRMRNISALPLIMEPQSNFYEDPVIVLDFASLYPSVMIAYNYCFSTCLGEARREDRDDGKFGCAGLGYRPPAQLFRDCKGNPEARLNASPNPEHEVMFVKKEVRTGILPTMLKELLDTRAMVKRAIKENGDNETLKQLLTERQLGLKLLANVTYGYTAASFSGRMPSVDIADSIVAKGKATLERAKRVIEEKWKDHGAEVVYGDTDSVFVKLPGATKASAFRLGRAMAAYVTKMEPAPVTLKFEKVYLPCLLQTKKRYVGSMYETEEQVEPVFEAKGTMGFRHDLGVHPARGCQPSAVPLAPQDMLALCPYPLDADCCLRPNVVTNSRLHGFRHRDHPA